MRKLLLTIGLVVSLGTLSACGGSSDSGDTKTTTATQAAKTFDSSKVSTLCTELLDSKAFTDSLAETSAKIIATQMKLEADKYANITCYKGSGATAEEFTIIEATNGTDLTDTIKSYVSEQKTNFESYLPDEVPKLESAIIKHSGNFFVLVIANDNDAANAVLDNYLD